MSTTIELRAIGIVHTPYREKIEAPRQPPLTAGAPGQIVLFPDRNFEHALEDLAGFSHIWLVFLFHHNRAWRPKVLPPRSAQRRGVFATRSPHRPNPIGLSLIELVAVTDLTLHVRGVDMLDGSPVLDIKPYVPYADTVTGARTGWLEQEERDAPAVSETANAPRDPQPAYQVEHSALARRQLEFLRGRLTFDLEARLTEILALGPEPHPYRRIRRHGDGLRVAVKDWRADFVVRERVVIVQGIHTGYRPRQLAEDPRPELDVHRAFAAEFAAS